MSFPLYHLAWNLPSTYYYTVEKKESNPTARVGLVLPPSDTLFSFFSVFTVLVLPLYLCIYRGLGGGGSFQLCSWKTTLAAIRDVSLWCLSYRQFFAMTRASISNDPRPSPNRSHQWRGASETSFLVHCTIILPSKQLAIFASATLQFGDREVFPLRSPSTPPSFP